MCANTCWILNHLNTHHEGGGKDLRGNTSMTANEDKYYFLKLQENDHRCF